MRFKLKSDFSPCGDQPKAISELVAGIEQQQKHQVLLGATGTGKTFTIANVINQVQKPTLIMAHNKTLAAQLYAEFKQFFPDNAVAYFVSYYDYYQPEAYVASSDTFIEKDSAVNENIDRMRHHATRTLLERDDVIIIASVSCIYGLGSPEIYANMIQYFEVGCKVIMREAINKLVELQYERNDIDFHRGCFRVRGDVLEIFPADADEEAIRIEFFGDEIDGMCRFDPLTGKRIERIGKYTVFPKSHYVVNKSQTQHAINNIRDELKERLLELRRENKLVEAQRLEQRTLFDLEMFAEIGYCTGVENYSRHLTASKEGQPPPTLLSYLPRNALVVIDESHVSVPQIGGMYKGDRSRKQNLVDYGFRLPSALDNRPLRFNEFEERVPQCIHVSATPGVYELEKTEGAFVEQIIRPTGLLDPEVIIRPASSQVDDFIDEANKVVADGWRVLVTCLTKRMAEDLSQYLKEAGLKARYLHSDINTLERTEILRDLRLGVFDILVGINLLREGLDIPEVALVAILDADKMGFLRSKRSLIQTIGRTARNEHGRAILYADKMTVAMEAAIDETNRRREKQISHNKKHGIIPRSIIKPVQKDLLQYAKNNESQNDYADLVAENEAEQDYQTTKELSPAQQLAKSVKLERLMCEAAADLRFEDAARYRDSLQQMKTTA
ncbi:MAG: excinuclease ABC subunit UvrB [Mariprofundales bacterium]